MPPESSDENALEDGARCIESRECESRTCTNGLCRPPQGTVVIGGSCFGSVDCETDELSCTASRCQPENGTVPIDGDCIDASNCIAGDCEAGRCVPETGSVGLGEACDPDNPCIDGACLSGICANPPGSASVGAPCLSTSDCAEGTCELVCVPAPASVELGGDCVRLGDCQDGQCIDSLCRPPPGSATAGQGCVGDVDCDTGLCVDRICAAGDACTPSTVCPFGGCVVDACRSFAGTYVVFDDSLMTGAFSPCFRSNALSLACACPDGAQPIGPSLSFHPFDPADQTNDQFFCMAVPTAGSGFRGVFMESENSGCAGCAQPHLETSSCACPATSTAVRSRAVLFDACVESYTVCVDDAPRADFGGAFVLDEDSDCQVANPVTGTCTCPVQFQQSPIELGMVLCVDN